MNAADRRRGERGGQGKNGGGEEREFRLSLILF